LSEAAHAHGCAIHAYVLMTNHIHLLTTPSAAAAIGETLQALGRRFVPHINRSYGRSGTLWEGRYKASLVQDDAYLLTCYCYIERNPVRAGMEEKGSDPNGTKLSGRITRSIAYTDANSQETV
jgi:putative transposase